jgi:hypothetical protein
MTNAVFVGRLDPVPMSEASACGVSFHEVSNCFEHTAIRSDESVWLDLSKLDIDSLTLEARARDYAVLDRSVEWLLEPLAVRQPRTHSAFFSAGKPRLFIAEKKTEDVMLGRRVSWVLLLEVNGRVVEPEMGAIEEGYCERMQFDEWLSLPQQISHSWLWRATGWKLPREVPCPPMTYRQMIRTTTEGIDQVLDSFDDQRKEHKRLLDEYIARFPDIAPRRKGGRNELRCFLDTRPMGVSGPVGDQFFTRSRMRDGTVYHVRNGDAAHLRVLHAPAEAFDCYHEHLLLKNPGEFDFSAWSKPLGSLPPR